MRIRCRLDLSGLNCFIMRAGRLEGPPAHRTHKGPWKHQTQYNCQHHHQHHHLQQLCVEDNGRKKRFVRPQNPKLYSKLCMSLRDDVSHNLSECMCFLRKKILLSLAYKNVLKTWCSDGGERHICIQQIRHVRHVTGFKSYHLLNYSARLNRLKAILFTS